jgi:hypothetical protein
VSFIKFPVAFSAEIGLPVILDVDRMDKPQRLVK